MCSSRPCHPSPLQIVLRCSRSTCRPILHHDEFAACLWSNGRMWYVLLRASLEKQTCPSVVRSGKFRVRGVHCSFSPGETGRVGGYDRGLACARSQGRGRHRVHLPLAPQQPPDRASLFQHPRADVGTPWVRRSRGGGLGCCAIGGGCGFLLPGAEHVSSETFQEVKRAGYGAW